MLNYSTFVFDCDGVVLNSNKVKTAAFRQAALPYGEDAADALVQYHVSNGGVSRYLKFEYFLENIVNGRRGPDLAQLLEVYAAAVIDGLMVCDVTPGLKELREATPDSNWLIVSGGSQSELRQVFAARGLSDWFDGGIFGSPDNKETILSRELATGRVQTPSLFLGDSRYDHIAASGAGLDFVFVSAWSEFSDWRDYVKRQGLPVIERVADLLAAKPG